MTLLLEVLNFITVAAMIALPTIAATVIWYCVLCKMVAANMDEKFAICQWVLRRAKPITFAVFIIAGALSALATASAWPSASYINQSPVSEKLPVTENEAPRETATPTPDFSRADWLAPLPLLQMTEDDWSEWLNSSSLTHLLVYENRVVDIGLVRKESYRFENTSTGQVEYYTYEEGPACLLYEKKVGGKGSFQEATYLTHINADDGEALRLTIGSPLIARFNTDMVLQEVGSLMKDKRFVDAMKSAVKDEFGTSLFVYEDDTGAKAYRATMEKGLFTLEAMGLSDNASESLTAWPSTVTSTDTSNFLRKKLGNKGFTGSQFTTVLNGIFRQDQYSSGSSSAIVFYSANGNVVDAQWEGSLNAGT